MKFATSIFLSFFVLALPSAKAAEYLYGKNFKEGAIGLVELHPVNNETVNSAPLCAQFLVKVKLTKIHEEGTSTLQALEAVSGSEKYFFTVNDFYGKFPNSERSEYKNFIKPGHNVYVAYQECGRSPVKHPLSIFMEK